MSNLVIPNSFQTPNAYVDIAMQYLTGDEFKVLMFAVRHIFGFQDRIEQRQHQMSLSMFQNGTPNMGGTNLSKNTLRKVLKQLVTYKLLERIPIRDETNGGMYRIGTSPDWDAMKTRHEEQTTKKQQRAEKMNAPQDGITSDVIPYDGMACDVIPGLPSDVIQSNPTLKPKEIPDANASGAQPVRTDPQKPKARSKAKPSGTTPRHELEKRDALYEDVERIIFKIVATDDDPYNFRGLCGNITKWLRGEIRKFKDEALPASPVVEITQRHLEEFVRRYRRANGDTSVPTYPPKFANHWSRLMSETRVAQPSSNGVYHDELDRALKTATHPRTGEPLTSAQRSITRDLLTSRYHDIEAQVAALESILMEHVP